MAERRMFAKTIVLSDMFLDMPLSARCLYFTLGMFADDDGFVNNPKSIMRQCGASQDDMNILIAKKYILIFESGIIVISHWRIHNYIRQDTYNPTKCREEIGQVYLNIEKTYEKIPSTIRGRAVDGTLPQYRIGKDRIDKDRIDNLSSIVEEENTDINSDNDTDSPISLNEQTEEAPVKFVSKEAKAFMERFNSIDGVAPCAKLHATREMMVNTILNNFEPIGVDKAFENLASSDFLRGKVEGTDGKYFHASFDWFIDLENFTKVLEGKYNNFDRDEVH